MFLKPYYTHYLLHCLFKLDECILAHAHAHGSYQTMQDYTEALLIEYDPTVVSYEAILKLWRSQHTPYPSKRQYRSAILYRNEQQKNMAESFCANETYVDVEPVTKFYIAEEYHQNYLAKMRSSRFGTMG